ncbi:MAG TPA: hypothetical protein VFH51_13695 [Myxococcota bacterium]|nr:hypothetical protein [Myxococcota bacterium]
MRSTFNRWIRVWTRNPYTLSARTVEAFHRDVTVFVMEAKDVPSEQRAHLLLALTTLLNIAQHEGFAEGGLRSEFGESALACAQAIERFWS